MGENMPKSIGNQGPVLIVEDDRNTAALVATYLEREGFGSTDRAIPGITNERNKVGGKGEMNYEEPISDFWGYYSPVGCIRQHTRCFVRG
jgi:hypothetical protein